MSAVQSDPEVQSGLEGVVAFATEIAEPDREGGALRYRGVNIESLVGAVPYEQVWGLLVDGRLKPGLPPAEPHALTVRSGDHRVDVQSALAMLAPGVGLRPADRHHRRGGPGQPRPRLRDGALVRGPVGARRRPAARPAVRDRPGKHDPRALSAALARRGQPRPREGDRRLLDLGRRARDERLHVHRPCRGIDGRGRRGGAVRGRRGPLRAAARRRALARAEDARGSRTDRRRGALGKRRAGPRRPADGLRPQGLPRGRPARAGVARDQPRARAPRDSRPPRRSRRRRWPSCRPAGPTACSRRTSSSGRP